VLSSSELAFRLHGLEFARARLASSVETFARGEEIVFGSGAHETLLTPESQPLFDDLMGRLRALRRTDGDKRHPLWRMQPERWLESEVKAEIAALDSRLDPAHVYAQVPAFAASDRGMIDLLAATRDGQLAVIELKADEDIHLPLQGLDYWSRVKWHHDREDFTASDISSPRRESRFRCLRNHHCCCLPPLPCTFTQQQTPSFDISLRR
jgi:hypothetical protein